MSEIQELLRKFAAETADEKQARLVRRQRARIELRARVRKGETSEHIRGCERCLSAILNEDTTGCPIGRDQHPGLWDVNGRLA